MSILGLIGVCFVTIFVCIVFVLLVGSNLKTNQSNPAKPTHEGGDPAGYDQDISLYLTQVLLSRLKWKRA